MVAHIFHLGGPVVVARILFYLLPPFSCFLLSFSTKYYPLPLLFARFYYYSPTCHHYQFLYVMTLQFGVLLSFVELRISLMSHNLSWQGGFKSERCPIEGKRGSLLAN